jgi:hypothetical protein
MPFRNGLRLAGQAVIERSAPGGKRRCPRWVCGNSDSSSTVLAEAQGQTSWESMVGLWKSQKRSATSMA